MSHDTLVSCPLGLKCPTTKNGKHRPGSKELADHKKRALGKNVEPPKTLGHFGFTEKSGATENAAPPRPKMTFSDLSSFVMDADISVEQIGGSFMVSRGDIGKEVTLSQSEAEFLARSGMDSPDFDSDVLVGLNEARSKSANENMDEAALVATVSIDRRPYRKAARDYLSTRASVLKMNGATRRANEEGIEAVRKAISSSPLADSALIPNADDADALGREIADTFGFKPVAGTGHSDGEGYAQTFEYTDYRTGEKRTFDLTGSDAFYGRPTPYSYLAKSTADLMNADFANRGESGLVDMVAHRNYVSFGFQRVFSDIAHDAHEEYVTRDHVSYLARKIFGEVEQ